MQKIIHLKALMLLIALASSCTRIVGVEKSVGVKQAYTDSNHRQNLIIKEMPSFLKQERPLPVIYPAEVFSVYVPGHVSKKRDILIGDHWVFIKLKESNWYLERLESETSSTQDAAPEDIENFQQRFSSSVEDILVPYKQGSE